MNLNAAEFMQYLKPVGGGASLKTWPRCEPDFLLLTSAWPEGLFASTTFFFFFFFLKLG